MPNDTNRTRNDTTRPRQVKPILSLEETLQEIKRRHLILTYGRSGRPCLWAPNTYVPRPIRQAVSAYSQQLHRHIARSSIDTCASPDLHRQEWDYRNRRYVCRACERLLAEVS